MRCCSSHKQAEKHVHITLTWYMHTCCTRTQTYPFGSEQGHLPALKSHWQRSCAPSSTQSSPVYAPALPTERALSCPKRWVRQGRSLFCCWQTVAAAGPAQVQPLRGHAVRLELHQLQDRLKELGTGASEAAAAPPAARRPWQSLSLQQRRGHHSSSMVMIEADRVDCVGGCRAV
jgi:hypothetical protein